MSSSTAIWYGSANEDSSYSVLARLTALDATGTLVSADEGYCLKKVDVSTITAKVYSLGNNSNASTGTVVTPDPTVVVNTSIFDTLQTVGWTGSSGYNFRHDLSPTYSPEPNIFYAIEYKITLATGGIMWLKIRVRTLPVIT